MKSKALAAYAPGGALDRYEYEMKPLRDTDVRIRVMFCGLSKSDLHMIDNDWFLSQYPQVVGHELIGTIVEKGENVAAFEVGDRVGLGWFSDFCHTCEYCAGDEQHLCRSAQSTMVQRHGGLAEFVDAHEQAVVHIDESLDPVYAVSLIGAGAAAFSPFNLYDVPAHAKVAVIGVGGLGHLALKIAKAWGCGVTAFTHTADKHQGLLEMGVDDVVDMLDENAILATLSSFDLMISTVTESLDWQSFIACLKPKGRLHFLAAPMNQLELGVLPLLSQQRCISGSLAASPSMIEDALQFSVVNDIQAEVEVFKCHEIQEALEHLRAGKLRYSAVIDMSDVDLMQ